MYQSVRHFGVFALAAFAAACASTPGSAPGGVSVSSSLSLCKGVRISNAPQTDQAGRIYNFDPVAHVNGVSLLRAPVNGCVSSGFGPRRGGAGSFHEGLDIFTRAPKTVIAGGGGVIEAVETLRGYGKTILIDHGRGVKTRYAHLSAYASGMRAGRRIETGEPIGETGRTGNATAVHLHYEIIVNGRPHNPLTIGR